MHRQCQKTGEAKNHLTALGSFFYLGDPLSRGQICGVNKYHTIMLISNEARLLTIFIQTISSDESMSSEKQKL